MKFDSRSIWECERLNSIGRYKYAGLYVRCYYFLTPVGKGMAWSCTMESTYRIFNLFNSNIDKKSELFQDCVLKEASFIAANIERHSNNNHILFNYIGLVLADEMFELYDHYYHSHLYDEISKQFNGDGTNFEASTAYHLLSLEAILMLVNFVPRLKSKLFSLFNVEDAIAFVHHVKCDSGIFVVGDNDGSNCFDFSQKQKNGFSHNKKLIQIENIERLSDSLSVKHYFTKFYNDFGLFSVKRNNYHFILSNTNHGQNGKAGHNHNDCCSIFLEVGGYDFVVDPGVFLYSIKRNSQRSIQNHSSPYFLSENGEAIQPEAFTSSFRLTNNSKREMQYNSSTVKSSYGFVSQSKDFEIVREVSYDSDNLTIHDYAKTTDTNVRVGLTLCLAPGVDCYIDKSRIHLWKNGISVSIHFLDDCYSKIEKSFHFYEYGKWTSTRKVSVIFKGKELKWKIVIN
ncbi:heparinase II/III domain-containing protein [Shewanella algae]|uniref:heparinase II/III domain-containing protein n=1 Tax=Shewanella algae TaxID=38313 RepID=UPI0016445BB3|nr:heparinase II/III family protein [Shewanella algae]